MARRERSNDCSCCISQTQGLSRPSFWDEFAQVSRIDLSDRRELLEYSHAAGQPLHGALVVPQAIHIAAELQGQDHLARFRRDQLPRQYFSEWEADCQFR